VQWQMHRTGDAHVIGCHSFVLGVAICRLRSINLPVAATVVWRWHAACTKAIALYAIVARFGRAPKTFSKRAHERACSRPMRITLAHEPGQYLACVGHVSPRAERIERNLSQACDAQPDRINVINHEASGEKVMNTARKLGPHTQTDRGTCPGVGL
jgi:hypothetical protein